VSSTPMPMSSSPSSSSSSSSSSSLMRVRCAPLRTVLMSLLQVSSMNFL
jgi:hypothetical protein